MPIGSSLISLLGIVRSWAEFFVVWRMFFSSSRDILEFKVESKSELSGWSIIRFMLSVLDELSLCCIFRSFRTSLRGLCRVDWLSHYRLLC